MCPAAWNPSSIKLYSSATGKICSTCCGTSITCPAKYTVSFCDLISCSPPAFGSFVTGTDWGPGDFVSYNGSLWHARTTHYASQWFPQYWEAYDPYYNAERMNKTFVLTRSGGDCDYVYDDGVIYIRLRLSEPIYNLFYADVRHRLYPSEYSPYGALDPYKNVFRGSITYTPSSPVWCEEVNNNSSSVSCIDLLVDGGFTYIYNLNGSDVVGHSGKAKFWPGTFEGWEIHTGYQVGKIVAHRAEKYTCTASHYSTLASEPGLGDQWASYWTINTDCG